MSFFEQIRMWANYPWAGGDLDPAKTEKASQMLHKRTAEAMADFQRYVEPIHQPVKGRRSKRHAWRKRHSASTARPTSATH